MRLQKRHLKAVIECIDFKFKVEKDKREKKRLQRLKFDMYEYFEDITDCNGKIINEDRI